MDRLVEVFAEVRRVLADDGTLWLNLGDSYAASWGNQSRKPGRGSQRPINGPMMQNVGVAVHAPECDMDEDCTCGAQDATIYPDRTHTGSWVNGHETIKPKDLIGIPWRVAFALQDDGWYLRSDIIWAKPNPMPESVTDRPTKAHEYMFLLAKSQRYYYDADAIREPSTERASGNVARLVAKQGERARLNTHLGSNVPYQPDGTGRNRRTVWTFPTEPFPGAHFAVMPTALVEPCVLAGSAVGDTVIDPFAGSGTVGVIARKHRRAFVGIDLNQDYCRMARGRLGQDVTHEATADEMPLFWRSQ